MNQQTDTHLEAAEPLDPITLELQGTKATFKVKSVWNQKPKGGKRGEIMTFSPAARLRLIKRFHALDWKRAGEALFVTLTYPDPCSSPDRDERKAHKKEFARLLEQLTGQTVPAVWRIEWETRKSGSRIGEFAPHWHLLIFKHRYIHHEDINLCWRKAIGFDGYVRTEIGRMRKADSIRLYLAKYISKEAVSPSLVYAASGRSLGKAYGYLRSSEIPMCPIETYTNLTARQIAELMKLAEEQLPWVQDGSIQPWTALGGMSTDVRKILSSDAIDTALGGR